MRSTLLHAAQILQDAQGAQEAGERPRLCVLHEFPPRSQVQDETGAKGVLPSPGDALDKGSAIMPIIICKLRLKHFVVSRKILDVIYGLKTFDCQPPSVPMCPSTWRKRGPTSSSSLWSNRSCLATA